MHIMGLSHDVHLLGGLLAKDDHILIFMLPPLAQSRLQPELRVDAEHLARFVALATIPIFFPLELIDPREGLLEDRLAQSLRQDLATAPPPLRVALPPVEQVVELGREEVALVLLCKGHHHVFVDPLLLQNIVLNLALPPRASVQLATVVL
mmetsp:Transcript_14302/g.19412  ORF Transcript_14302/g.19412 Transcript_14302/m.19412 type:complete len:151 (-) Transcript_14302:1114-1566(-)